MRRLILKFGWLVVTTWLLTASTLSNSRAQQATLTFAVIGDYGTNNAAEQGVANLVASWNPDLVVTTGDNYYSSAGGSGSARYDVSTGAYYCAYLKEISTTGSFCPGPGGSLITNRFFPSLGNHDYSDTGSSNSLPSVYTNYFTLPGAGYTSTSGNERYYDYIAEPVHFFVLNSESDADLEPDGADGASVQAQWLKARLAASTSLWNIVYFHRPPFSSGSNGSTSWMQWPFEQWGADAVLSSHDHDYERIIHGQLLYFVNGLGGASRSSFGSPVSGSAIRYSANWGAQKVTATPGELRFEFFSIENGGTLIDAYSLANWHVFIPLITR